MVNTVSLGWVETPGLLGYLSTLILLIDCLYPYKAVKASQPVMQAD